MESNYLDSLTSGGGADPRSAGRTASSGVNIDDLVREVVRIEASDLHLKAGLPPAVRVSGLLPSTLLGCSTKWGSPANYWNPRQVAPRWWRIGSRRELTPRSHRC